MTEMTKITGKVWRFGNDINTDYMAPSFSKDLDWEQQAKSILHIHQGFTAGFQVGDVIVGGNNFGCGSSREAAPANLKRLGVGCVVAESFGRIFYRNAIAIAFPVLVCPGISNAFEEGDMLELDFSKSEVVNINSELRLKGAELPEDLLRIVAAGGILQMLKAEVQAGA